MKSTLLALAAAVALVVGAAGQAQAALLTITDDYGTLWSLELATNCQTCAATLTAQLSDTSGEAGKYLQNVQIQVAGSSITGINFLSTTAGSTTDWDWGTGNLSNAGCQGPNPRNSACSSWASGGVANGFGPLVAGGIYEWVLELTFRNTLLSPNGGNIRAAFNNPDGSNFYIFSPGGGTFDGGGDGGTFPEPTTLALFGAALAMAGARLRRKQ